MTIYQLQTVYVSMGLVFGLITFGMTLYALRLALARRRTALTAWLIPTVVAQVFHIVYSVWTLLFRWLGLRTTVASTFTVTIWQAIAALIGLYATVRFVTFIRIYCREAEPTLDTP